MITDLFSSMDGGHSLLLWSGSLFLGLFILTNSMWPVKVNSVLCVNISSMWKNSSHKSLPTLGLFLTSMMTILMFNNLLGLTPLVYGCTSSLWINFSFAFLLWLTLIFSGWTKSPVHSLAHLCPSGSPLMLIPLLVLIETISILIRPLTLTVRLLANISAGHIVMSLISNTLSSLLENISTMFMMYLLMSLYMLFEFFVSLIQAYIFTLLISLYAEDHP